MALSVTSPEGEFYFERREGEDGRAWTMQAGGATPTPVETVAVEDLLYKLNSTDADGIGGEDLPEPGAAWIFAVTEELDDGEEAAAPETVRLSVSPTGGIRALRAGDERTLAVGAGAWAEIADLFASARAPREEP